jgi:MraZ protein
MLRVNRKGNKCLIDSKGRVLIPQNLRENAKLEEEVEVIGLSDHLEVWNKSVLDESIEQGPLTNEDFENMADLLPQDKNK